MINLRFRSAKMNRKGSMKVFSLNEKLKKNQQMFFYSFECEKNFQTSSYWWKSYSILQPHTELSNVQKDTKTDCMLAVALRFCELKWILFDVNSNNIADWKDFVFFDQTNSALKISCCRSSFSRLRTLTNRFFHIESWFLPFLRLLYKFLYVRILFL